MQDLASPKMDSTLQEAIVFKQAAFDGSNGEVYKHFDDQKVSSFRDCQKMFYKAYKTLIKETYFWSLQLHFRSEESNYARRNHNDVILFFPSLSHNEGLSGS